MPLHYYIRSMQSSDLDNVCRLEAQTNTYSWNMQKIQESLDGDHECLVCCFSDSEPQGRETQKHEPELEPELIAGYCVFSTVLDEANLLNLCVAKDFQGKGLGRELLSAIIGRCRSQKILQIFLEVRESNFIAIQLYESCGFEYQGLRKDYYLSETGRENAKLYCLTLPSAE